MINKEGEDDTFFNSDDEQQLSQAFGIRSIPTCVLMVDGKPADGFMDALPEGKLREFLDKHLPGENELMAEEDLSAAEELLAWKPCIVALQRVEARHTRRTVDLWACSATDSVFCLTESPPEIVSPKLNERAEPVRAPAPAA